MRTLRLIGLFLFAMLVITSGGEAQTAKQKKKKAAAAKLAAGPQIAVVGDADATEEYSEQDATEGAGAGLPEASKDDKPAPPKTAEPEHTVTVTCDRPNLAEGLTLRAIGFDPEKKLYRLFTHSATFDREGKCALKLPEGRYHFEVLGGRDGTIIALRSGERRVAGVTNVLLRAAEPTLLELHAPDGSIPLREVAIRSGADSGEVRWQAAAGQEEPQVRVALSSDQKYRARALGFSGNSAYAVWREITGGAPRLDVNSKTATTCRFRWAAGGPQAKDGGVIVGFPESQLEFPITPETVLLTNRRFVLLSYWLQTAAGRKVSFHERGYTLPAQGGSFTFDLGGALSAFASGIVVVDKRPRIHQISWFADLRDSRGHVVNGRQSSIESKASLQRRDGTPVSPAELHGEADELRTLLTNLVAVIRYQLDDKPVEQTLPLAPFAQRQSEHFILHAPESWDWRAACYLAKCERIFRFTEEMTGRRHPRKVHVSWHASRVSLGGTFGISMPLSGLRDSFGWYHYPEPIIHEIHHAFGYPHGDAMRYAHKLVASRLREYRWYMADHPDEMP
jgi:hypothetical protein